jgi:hypothetical protein
MWRFFDRGKMTPQTEMDKNLLVVTAIQGYAANHNISESATYEKFEQHDMISLIREQYDALHTQDLEETVAFAEDVMKRYESQEA